MGVPYETPPMSGILVNGGQSRVVAVPFPSRTVINKVVIEQYLGTAADYTVELFNHGSVQEGGGVSQSDSVGSEVGPIPEACYKLGAALSSGPTGHLQHFGLALPFYSQDPADPSRQGINRRTIYVRINCGGSGAKRFALCIGGDMAIGT